MVRVKKFRCEVNNVKVNKKVVAALVTVCLIAGAAVYKLWPSDSKVLKATGTIEVTRADAMPKANGYLSDLKVKAGDQVQVGQIIARITRSDWEAQIVRDEAALARAEAQLRDLEAGSRRQERQELVANVTSAQSVYDKARTDLNRYQALYDKGAVSAQQLDTAQSELDVAYNKLVAAKERLSLTEAGTRPETIEAQRLEVERSKAVLAASRALLEDTIIKSPISGLILSKNYENGEYVNPGAAIITIGDMLDCWVKVYIPSTHLGQVVVGRQAEVKVDSFPGRIFPGIVQEIAQQAEFTPRQSITPSERANLVFAVKVKVDNNQGILKPGMPADVILP